MPSPCPTLSSYLDHETGEIGPSGNAPPYEYTGLAALFCLSVLSENSLGSEEEKNNWGGTYPYYFPHSLGAKSSHLVQKL